MKNLTMICNFGKYLLLLFLVISCKKDPEPDAAGNEDGYYMSYKAGSREYKYKKGEILFIGTVDLFNGIKADRGILGDAYHCNIYGYAFGKYPEVAISIYSVDPMKEKTYISDSIKVYASMRFTFPKQIIGGGDRYGAAKGVNISIIKLGTHTVKVLFPGH